MRAVFLALPVLLLFASCNREKEDERELIAGRKTKLWFTTGKIPGNESGSDPGTDTIKWVLGTGGELLVIEGGDTASGTWSYETEEKILTVSTHGMTVTRTFIMADLGRNKMVLETPAGEEITFEAME